MSESRVLLSIKNLQKYFPIPRKRFFQLRKEYVKANDNISLDIYEGETLGIVGESGCGKSTFGRTIIQLQQQTGGSSLYYGEDIYAFLPKYMRSIYRNISKKSQKYEQDIVVQQNLKNNIFSIQTNLSKADEATQQLLKEQLNNALEEYRLFRITFEEDYFNTFRLIGGLAAYDDLNEVSKAFLKRDSLLRQQKRTISASRLEKIEVQLSQIEHHLSSLRTSIADDPRFIKYDTFLDNGMDLSLLTRKESRYLRKDLQIIFQDPYSSLDPRSKVSDIIGEGLLIHKRYPSSKDEGYKQAILDIMRQCGLDDDYIHRYPHQFSGGQRQRIGIARALALRPKFIVCDEAVSALDVSIQSQIINLLQELKKEFKLTYLFITHDLGVVRYISNRIGVMYFGKLVELAPAEDIFTNPQHPYTRQLLNAMPILEDDYEAPKQWDIVFETDQFSFQYQTGLTDDHWFEVTKDHFVACTLHQVDSSILKEETV
jgi:peptide/nickel transport system ATP-binding protein